MRTALTQDEDVAEKLKAKTRRAGRPFRDVLSETLRRGLASRRDPVARKPFKVAARDLGESTPGLSLDDVAGLIEQAEGPLARRS